VSTVRECVDRLQQAATVCPVVNACLDCIGQTPVVTCSSDGHTQTPGCDSACNLDLCKRDSGGPAPSGTPGKIACGGSTCDVASQHCCDIDGARFCESNALAGPAAFCHGDASSPKSVFVETCDDSADCAAGSTCCAQAQDGVTTTIGCIPDVSPPLACPLYEACVPNGVCKTGKTGCTPEGVCLVQNTQVACAGAACSGATPVCCAHRVDGSTQTAPVCASGSACGPDDFTMRCTQSSECGTGQTCCREPYGTVCKGVCQPGVEPVTCTSTLDCGNTGQTCLPDPTAPTALKTCQ
jgi:hypothetical protein